MQDPGGVFGRARVVRHHHDGFALLATERLEQMQDLIGVLESRTEAVRPGTLLLAETQRSRS